MRTSAAFIPVRLSDGLEGDINERMTEMKLHKVDKWTITATVGDLVSELLKFDQNAYVFTEGCDCTGNVVDVSLETDGTILIVRDDRAIHDGMVHERYKDRMAECDGAGERK